MLGRLLFFCVRVVLDDKGRISHARVSVLLVRSNRKDPLSVSLRYGVSFIVPRGKRANDRTPKAATPAKAQQDNWRNILLHSQQPHHDERGADVLSPSTPVLSLLCHWSGTW